MEPCTSNGKEIYQTITVRVIYLNSTMCSFLPSPFKPFDAGQAPNNCGDTMSNRHAGFVSFCLFATCFLDR